MDLSMNLQQGSVSATDALVIPERITAQVVTGIDFIGGGTIMQSRGAITGLTSAATIWMVAAIGLTIGAGFFVEGLSATAIAMLVSRAWPRGIPVAAHAAHAPSAPFAPSLA